MEPTRCRARLTLDVGYSLAAGEQQQYMTGNLRVIGDVHAQIEHADLFTRDAQPYLEIIAEAAYSIQLGDMGDGETYGQLTAQVDIARHRFFPGNHDYYEGLPPHSLGDFGSFHWGGVSFFFVRGASSSDRELLDQLGHEQGKTLWFKQEELTDDQMHAAFEEYSRDRPRIVLSHDAPTHVARSAWQNAHRFGAPNSRAAFCASRTTDFLERLLEHHQPRLWLFGHHHRDWRRQEGATLFACVGELSYVDIDSAGNVSGRHFAGWQRIPTNRAGPLDSRAEQSSAPPNGGPATRLGNSGVAQGPPSVS